MNKPSTISAGISVFVGEVSPAYFSLKIRPPREFSLGFGAIEVSLWRCSELLPEVSPVFDRTEATLGEISPTYASLSEVSLEMRPLREFSLGSGTIEFLFAAVADYYRSIRSYRSYSWGDLSHIRQPSRGLSGNASPP